MVRKTSSGFFSIQENVDLPYHLHRGYHSGSPSPQLPPRHVPKQRQSREKSFDPATYTKPFLSFMTENPTIFHTVATFAHDLEKAGFEHRSARDTWKIEAGGKYYTTRNATAIIAWTVGSAYKAGDGIAIVAGHIDALTAKLKPVSKLPNKAGYMQLGVAPYAGAMSSTWWDRDLGIAGRVLVKTSTGKIEQRLVNLDWPIARIPTLAPHFGQASQGPFNAETQVVPIIGIDNSDLHSSTSSTTTDTSIPVGTFAATQPPKLVKLIAESLNVTDYASIVNWELELYDTQPARLIGLEKDMISAGRLDDKLCSWAAIQALLSAAPSDNLIQMVGCFDDEEIGSLLRQGARSNFMSNTIERLLDSLSSHSYSPSLFGQTMANSFLVSSDVTHAVNPNFLNAYLENHAPRLNVGVTVSADPNGHMTTDAVSTAVLQRIAEKCGATLQVFQIRNDSRSGGTIGPMTSSLLGCRGVDAGIPQLSMHSIRATTGSLDPGLGVKLFKGVFEHFHEVDSEFRA